MPLTTYYGEVVHTGVMTYGVGMVIDGERDPEMSHEQFWKGP